MGTITTSMLIMFLLAGGITTLAMLSVFANAIRHETQLHDLRNRVKELHYQHAMYLAKLSGKIAEEGEIEILDDDSDDETANRPAAKSAAEPSPPAAEPIEATEIIEADEITDTDSTPAQHHAEPEPEPEEAPNLSAA